MTTITDMVDRTVALTRRPEIQDLTEAAIRTATLRAHHVDFFPRDLTSTVISYVPASTVFYDFPNISATLPRLRSIKTLQSVAEISGIPQEQLEYRDIDDLYTRDGFLRPSIYTLRGDTLRVYPQIATSRLEVFYFQNPATAGFTYSSWIASTYPDELAAWAAAIVFARTGFAEMAEQFTRMHVDPFRSMLVESHLLGNVS